MQTVVVVPPDPVLSAATVRARLGISDRSGDANLDAYIAAATAAIDGPDGWLGRAIGLQTLRADGSHFPEFFRQCGFDDTYYGGYGGFLHREAIKLIPPVVSITSITYFDADGVQQTLDPSAYALSGRALSPVYGTVWPSSRMQAASVQITYVAGYPNLVPSPILAAIIMGVAKLRSMIKSDIALKVDTVVGVQSYQWETMADFGSIYERAAAALLAPYRVID